MCRHILWNCLAFRIEINSWWYDGVTHYQWHSVVQMGSGKEDSCHHCCIMYNSWSKPSPPSNRCRVLCRRCMGKWYGATCTYGNCSSDTLGGISAYSVPHDILYNTTKTIYQRVSLPRTCDDCSLSRWLDIKNQLVGNMLVRKSSFVTMVAKIQLFKSYCYPIYGWALSNRVFQNCIRKLTVSYSDTFKRRPQIHLLQSGICDKHNQLYQCGVTQNCLQLDEQSNSFPQQYCYSHCNNSDDRNCQ